MRVSDSTVETLARLVGFDTTSRDSNLELIDYIESRLAARGFTTRRFPSADRHKTNLFASIGPDASNGVILSAHTDCVPVDGQRWATDPFELVDGGDRRWYGRGTADMKGFIACVLGAVDSIDATQLARPLHLALSYDEEIGGNGAELMIDTLLEEGLQADACVVGEPTSMQVVTAHKGIFTFRCVVDGVEAHSSLAPSAVNAVEYAARMVTFLQDMGWAKAANGPHDRSYDVTHTTLNVGPIAGGTALNIVPKHCAFEFEFRHLPQDDPEPILGAIEGEAARLTIQMRRLAPDVGVRIEPRGGLPRFSVDVGAEVVDWARRLTKTGATKVAYGTEAGLFADVLGVPTVVCGPGSIEQAHRPDEYILDDQLVACHRFVEAVIVDLSA